MSILHLCLVAHGVHLKINPPRSPTRNAKVERNQGTTARWSEVWKCLDYLDLQDKLNQAVIDQRENYPTRVCNGLTRTQTYPELLNNKVRFDSADFKLNRIYTLLRKGKWIRKVSDRGSIILFGKYYQLGAKNKGKRITAKFSSTQITWDFFDTKGTLLKSLKPKGITKYNLINGIK